MYKYLTYLSLTIQIIIIMMINHNKNHENKKKLLKYTFLPYFMSI